LTGHAAKDKKTIAEMQKEDFPPLEFPSCDRATKPRSLNGDGSVPYTCEVKNHLATAAAKRFGSVSA